MNDWNMSATDSGRAQSEELTQVFRESDDPVLTAVEVAEHLGISQQAAHARLSRANDRGEIERKKTGARSVVWWVPGETYESP